MAFDRSRRPDAPAYFEGEGLKLTGRGKWRTTECKFHGGSDSMRINLATGAWVCMSCGEKGGDVLAYHMQAHGLEFVDAAKALGCWQDDGKPTTQHKPTPLSPRQALEVLAFESMLVAVAAGNVAKGISLTEADLMRVLQSAARINKLSEVFA